MRLSRCRPLVTSARSTLSCYRPTVPRNLTVLALESSADDSCASIINSEREILSNVVIKQHHLNVKHGGIHPLEAQHAHERNVVSLLVITVLIC
jgi:N6-L-threonylcarbamoyladenine synthase